MKVQMRKIGKKIVISAMILIAGILLGITALCFVHLIPTQGMQKNLTGSIEAINACDEMVPGYMSSQIDNYTDAIMLNQAICPVQAPLMEKAIYNYYANYRRGYMQQENLLRFLQGEEGYDFAGNTHYWGGHQVPIKLALLVMDYSDILILNGLLQGILMLLIVAGLVKRERLGVAIAFGVASSTVMPMTISMSLQYCTVWYPTLLAMLFILWKYEKIVESRLYLVFLILGMTISYFDFLTYPFVALGFPLVLTLSLNDDFSKWKEQILRLIESSIAWCAGYGGMWAGKWIFSAIVMPESLSLEHAIDSLHYRGSNFSTDGVVTLIDVLLKNMYVYLRRPTIFVMGCAVVVFGILAIMAVRGAKIGKWVCLQAIPYLLVCLYPAAWYLISRNHSYEHCFMAYRELAIATFAGLSLLEMISRLPEKRGKHEEIVADPDNL